MTLPAVSVAQVRIIYHFEYPQFASAVLPSMEHEVARLLEVKPYWQPKLKASQRFARATANIQFFGRCGPKGPDVGPETRLDEPLGWTHTAMGREIIPYSGVDCDRIRVLLSPELLRARDPEMTFAIAVARIAAHELVHSLLHDKDHTQAGLMQPCLYIEELTSKGLALDALHARGIAKLTP